MKQKVLELQDFISKLEQQLVNIQEEQKKYEQEKKEKAQTLISIGKGSAEGFVKAADMLEVMHKYSFTSGKVQLLEDLLGSLKNLTN